MLALREPREVRMLRYAWDRGGKASALRAVFFRRIFLHRPSYTHATRLQALAQVRMLPYAPTHMPHARIDTRTARVSVPLHARTRTRCHARIHPHTHAARTYTSYDIVYAAAHAPSHSHAHHMHVYTHRCAGTGVLLDACLTHVRKYA